MNLKFLFVKLVYPVTVCLGLTLAIPCILSRSIAPIFSKFYISFIAVFLDKD
jgi:hypothetical protein